MADDFDDPEPASTMSTDPSVDMDLPPVKRNKWGWYLLPAPGTTMDVGWQRTTTLIDFVGSKYHLELWKQRSVAKGIATKPALSARVAMLDVKADRDELNDLVERALEAAGAKAGADLGTAMHKMGEHLDHTGSMDAVPEAFRPRFEEYQTELRRLGISIVPGYIERQIVSQKYNAGGQLDRVYRLADGSYVIGDLKTQTSMDFDFTKIEAQLAVYQDGVNTAGVWTKDGWDTSIRVREDIGLVVHLPSDRPGCTVYVADLESGRRRLEVCMQVRSEQKRKSPLVEFGGVASPVPADGWEERLNAANTYDELVSVVGDIKRAGCWTRELSHIARKLAGVLA